MPAPANTKIILASASVSRARILTNAGLDFLIKPSDCDEDTIKKEMKASGQPTEKVAERLAMAKAEIIVEQFPDHYVIGADQMLACDGVWFDKPHDLNDARNHLQSLRGKTHQLISATVILSAGKSVWRYVDKAHLTMRSFSDDFIEDYLQRAGRNVCRSVGAYQLEGLGAQLFSDIEGDYFSILGLPLLPIMNFLRDRDLLNE